MRIADLLSRECVACDLKVTSKKQLIQEMAQLMVEAGVLGDTKIEARQIIAAAMERERLGSTGVGTGVALPHARIDGLDRVHIQGSNLKPLMTGPLTWLSLYSRLRTLAANICEPLPRSPAVFAKTTCGPDYAPRLMRKAST